MSRDLQKETFVYKVPTEQEAVKLIEDEKNSSTGLVTYSTAYKTKTVKGEIVDSWYIVTVTHDYTK